MDYEKKYKEAQGWIEKIYPTLQHEQQMEAEAFFPELAESKDERIRKAIHIYLDWLDGRKDCQPKGDYTIKDMIAWLEKQDEQKSAWSKEDRTMAFTLMRDIDQMSYISEEGKNERIGWLNSLDEKFTSTESAWSEEDEQIILSIEQVMNCASLLNIVPEKMDKIRTWLKSLKQRIGG